MKINRNPQTDTDTYADTGLKKAARSIHYGKLPSNFSYRMMDRINTEVWKKEKKRERRLFISMIMTCIIMIGTCAGIIWMYWGSSISERLSQIALPEHVSIHEIISDIFFYLPTLISLILIFFLNRFIRKKFGYLLNQD